MVCFNNDIYQYNIWYDGIDNEMCQTVLCNNYAIFEIKDGNGCKNSNNYTISIDGIDNIICDNGGRDESCKWTIPTPNCEIYPDYASEGSDDDSESDKDDSNNNSYILED